MRAVYVLMIFLVGFFTEAGCDIVAQHRDLRAGIACWLLAVVLGVIAYGYPGKGAR